MGLTKQGIPSVLVPAGGPAVELHGFMQPVDEADVKAGAVGLGEISKGFGLTARKTDGTRLAIDDPELDPIWQTAARLNIPVLIHTADPQEFFQPLARARSGVGGGKAHSINPRASARSRMKSRAEGFPSIGALSRLRDGAINARRSGNRRRWRGRR